MSRNLRCRDPVCVERMNAVGICCFQTDCICVAQRSAGVASGLIETVDRVMEHMVRSLEPSPSSLISLGGTTVIAGQLSMR